MMVTKTEFTVMLLDEVGKSQHSYSSGSCVSLALSL